MSGHRARRSPVRLGGGRLAARIVAAALVVSVGGGCATGVGPAVDDRATVADEARSTSDAAVASAGVDSSRNPAALSGRTYAPIVDPGDFVRVIDNPLFPLTPGLTSVYESDGERVEVSVTFDTREIDGVTTIVVVDRAFVGDALVEETEEWFAQDRWGNVWYFGEQSQDARDGKVGQKVDSWLAGVAGAQPGIVMLAQPRAGDVYRQEFLRGAAEDMARVISIGHRIEVPYGSFSGGLKTEDWTPLEPGVVESKLYAPGIGLVLGRPVIGGEGLLRLVEVRPSRAAP